MSGWVAGATVVGGYIAGQGAKKAAKTAADAQDRASAEQGRQFDITQEQIKPWQEAGERGLEEYESRIGGYGEAEGLIPSNIPERFRSQSNIPQMYDATTGDYSGTVKSDIQDPFSFTAEDFQEYKDPGYEFRVDEGLRALDRRMAASGGRKSGYRTRGLMELGQKLGSQEFGAARGRALSDYESRVARESQGYGRSVDQYGREISREADVYNRDRTGYLDEANREQALYGRELKDYELGVARESEEYNRGLGTYARQYTDPLNRYASLANIGQSTTTNLGTMRSNYASNVASNTAKAGQYQAAGQLGQYGAYATAIGAAGKAYGGGGGGNFGNFDVWGNRT